MHAAVSPALRTIAQAWPRDAFRPHQFSSVLETLAESPNLRVRAVMAARALNENRLATQVRAVTLGLGNSSSNLYTKLPLSPTMTTPASSPLHYTRMTDAVERAMRGEKRSWIERFFSL